MKRSSMPRLARAFTLMELIVVMAIIALLSGSMMFVFSGMDEENSLRRPFSSVRSLAKKAWMRSLQEQLSWQIRILPDRFILEPKQSSGGNDRPSLVRADAVADPKANRQSRTEVFVLEPGTRVEVQHWGDDRWLVPRPDFWVFEYSGLSEPIKIRIVNSFGSIAAQFDPLTASAGEEEFIVH
jgi:prepilin-type N-terminal cleavage/methylation domain-containing protein